MGIITEAFTDVRQALRPRNLTSWSGIDRYVEGRAALRDGKYSTYAREGYMTNALVYACIEELATSASEPELQALQAERWVRSEDTGQSQAHRLLNLLSHPNDFMDHYEFWRTVILHRSIAGNAYALKVRSASGRVVQLWLLRPDRVAIVPDAQTFIRRYEYSIGGTQALPLPVNDVIHWKTPNPLDDFYGMPPLMAIASNVDLDNYSRDFVKQYFEKAGIPSGILSTKGKMAPDLKKEIKDRFAREYAGRGNWLGLMVLDGADASYTQMTQGLGAQGLVLPELNQITEARIAGAFGVPLSLVGTVVGTEASSYGNKKSERESFWNETLKPLYQELVSPLNRSLVPEFVGVRKVGFDLSTVGALQEDADKRHARIRADVAAGIISLEEGREDTGRDPRLPAGHTFLIPSNLTQTPSEKVGAAPEPVRAPALPAPAAVD